MPRRVSDYTPPGFVSSGQTGCKFGVCPKPAWYKGMASKGEEYFKHSSNPPYSPSAGTTSLGTAIKVGYQPPVPDDPDNPKKTDEENICDCKKAMTALLVKYLGPGLSVGDGQTCGPAKPGATPCKGANAGQILVALYTDGKYQGHDCQPLPFTSEEYIQYMGCLEFQKEMVVKLGFSNYNKIWDKC